MRRYLRILLLPILLVVTTQSLNHVRDGLVAFDGKFIGLDGYTHLLRAKQFVLTGDWFDHTIHRGNPPDGDELYWPRPFDAVLLAGAALLSPFMSFDAALHAWGNVVSPILHLLSLFVLLWAARPLFDDSGLTYLGILFAFQFFIIHIASVARPDHHSLLMLLFVWYVGAGLRLLAANATSRMTALAALPAILSMWISLESLVVTGALLATLGFAWIVLREHFARSLVVFPGFLTHGFAVTLVAEHGVDGLRKITYDAPSLVHLVLFAIITGAGLGFFLLDRHACAMQFRGARLAAAIVAVAVVATGMWLIFPKFYQGPLAEVDPEVVRLWFNDIAEFAPLLDPRNLVGSLPQFIFHIGPALLAIPFMLHRVLKGDTVERRYWYYLLFLVALYVVLAAMQQRWAGFAQYVLVIPYAALLKSLLDRIGEHRGLAGAAGRAVAVMFFAFAFPIAGVVMIAPPSTSAAAQPGCPLTDMSRWLATEPSLNQKTHRILSFINFGPELLYRTRHEVVVTPNHRNAASIRDGIYALGRLAPTDAKAIIDRRGIDLILVCRGTEEANDYRRGNDGNTLFAAMENDGAPGWLRSIPLPDSLSEGFLLYAVVH